MYEKKINNNNKKRRQPTKPINQGNLDYLGINVNFIEKQNKKKQIMKPNSQPP
jgi:hypothetical protein